MDNEQRPGLENAATGPERISLRERAQKVRDRMNAGALPSEAVAVEGFGEDEVYSEDSSIFELDDPDNDVIDFGREPSGEPVWLKRDRDEWKLVLTGSQLTPVGTKPSDLLRLTMVEQGIAREYAGNPRQGGITLYADHFSGGVWEPTDVEVESGKAEPMTAWTAEDAGSHIYRNKMLRDRHYVPGDAAYAALTDLIQRQHQEYVDATGTLPTLDGKPVADQIEGLASSAAQHVEQETNKVRAMTEPERKEYNGWATYETWAAGMFLDGNYTGEGTYREVQSLVNRLSRGLDDASTPEEIVDVRDELAVELQRYVVQHAAVEVGKPGSMESDLLAHALSEINWQELADGQLSAVEVEVPKDERASVEFDPNTTASPTSVVNKALSGQYDGPGVVAEAQQRVRHAAAQDSEYPAVRAADALKEYVDETRRLQGGGSLADDLIGAALQDVDWMALAKQRLPEPPAPAGSESPACRPARDAGSGPEPGISR